MSRVAVVGSWHLACVYAAGLAELGHTVVQADADPARIRGLAAGHAPLFERGLDELIARHSAAGGLRFTEDIGAAVAGAEIVYLADDVPLKNDLPDLDYVFARCRLIAPSLRDGVAFVISTQVPVGTCQQIAVALGQSRGQGPLPLVYHPEFLRLGTAIPRFLKPDYLVLGGNDAGALARVEALYAAVDCPKPLMGLADAEMVKHAANVYVALTVSFASEMGRLADALGVDGFQVGRALRHDKRVGPDAYILPGLGFTGGNLQRDIEVLQTLAREHATTSDILNAAVAVNERQGGLPLERVRLLLGDVKQCTVAIWGLAYKEGSSSTRGSYGIRLARELRAAGAQVRGFDPHVDRVAVERGEGIVLFEDEYEAARGADALAVMNPSARFAGCDLDRLCRELHRGNVFDAYGIFDSEKVAAAGLRYATVGRGYLVREPRAAAHAV